jgi:hypothetical protein
MIDADCPRQGLCYARTASGLFRIDAEEPELAVK